MAERVTPEEVAQAKQYDLLTYLQTARPHELERVSGNEYTVKRHDSLRISNGLWHWFSAGIGGKTALDYLIKVEKYPFVMAVKEVLKECAGRTNQQEYIVEDYRPRQKPTEKKEMKLPERAEDNDRAIAYLMGRGIDREVIEDCIARGLVYESAEKARKSDGTIVEYHNLVLCGKDGNGEVKYATKRGMGPKHYYGEVAGSDKRYGFCISGEENKEMVGVFESAIDAMSCATIHKMQSGRYDECSYLSLGGAAVRKGEKLPLALEEYLNNNKTNCIVLCLDNDSAGNTASIAIADYFDKNDTYIPKPVIYRKIPPNGKDFNDSLMHLLNENSKNLFNESKTPKKAKDAER